MPVSENQRIEIITAKPQAAYLTATAKNTAVPYAWRRILSTSFNATDVRVNTKDNKGAATGSYYPSERYTLSHDMRKTLPFDLNSDDIARFLYWACGSIQSVQPNAGTDPNVWTHTLKPLDLLTTLQLPAFGYAEKAGTGIDQEFVGQCIDSLTITGDSVDRITAQASMIGSGKRTSPSGMIVQPTASYNVPAPATLQYFTNSQVSLSVSDALTQANPVNFCANKRLNNWSIALRNTFAEDAAYRPCAGDFQTTGNNASGAIRSELLLTDQGITPTFNVRVEPNSVEQQYLQDQRRLEVQIALTGATISNAYKHALNFVMGISTYSAVQVGSSDGLLNFEITAEPLANLATGDVFYFLITNDRPGNTYV